MSMAIDTTIIAEQLYGRSGYATCNFINAPAAATSRQTTLAIRTLLAPTHC